MYGVTGHCALARVEGIGKLTISAQCQLILPMRFYFMRYFVNSIILRVPHRLLCCVFIEVDFEKKKMLEMFIFLQSKSIYNIKLGMQSLLMPTLLMV